MCVEPKVCFSTIRVGTVASKTVVGEDRTNIAFKRDTIENIWFVAVHPVAGKIEDDMQDDDEFEMAPVATAMVGLVGRHGVNLTREWAGTTIVIDRAKKIPGSLEW